MTMTNAPTHHSVHEESPERSAVPGERASNEISLMPSHATLCALDSRAPIFRTVVVLYWAVTIALFVAVTLMLIYWTPREATMGDVQKVFYIHLPAAINTFVACFVVFVASVGYLVQRRLWWDDLAVAAAKVAVLLASIVLITGMFWGRSAWGVWWTWSPRLTFSLILWLLYVVYLMIRPAIESSQKRALVSAVYGVIAFLDVPLVYLSARLLPDIHPSSIALAPAMRLTLLAWFVPMTLLAAGLIVARYRLNRRERAQEREIEDGLEHGLPARAH